MANFPSFSAISTGGSGTGNFSLALALPLEFAKGIGTAPGANASTPLPIHYSHMMSDFDNVSQLIYTEFTVTADAGRCTPGRTLDAAKIRIDALQKLAAAKVYENHAVSTHIFEENRASGPASAAASSTPA